MSASSDRRLMPVFVPAELGFVGQSEDLGAQVAVAIQERAIDARANFRVDG